VGWGFPRFTTRAHLLSSGGGFVRTDGSVVFSIKARIARTERE
jgi:hypothetical protein